MSQGFHTFICRYGLTLARWNVFDFSQCTRGSYSISQAVVEKQGLVYSVLPPLKCLRGEPPGVPAGGYPRGAVRYSKDGTHGCRHPFRRPGCIGPGKGWRKWSLSARGERKKTKERGFKDGLFD